MSETRRVTRVEANELIAGWFEPKPEPLSLDFHDCLSLSEDAKSEGAEWVWLCDSKGRWKPNYNYCGSIEAAWPLTDIEDYVPGGSEKFNEALEGVRLHEYKLDGVAQQIVCAFLYAITGERFEITD